MPLQPYYGYVPNPYAERVKLLAEGAKELQNMAETGGGVIHSADHYRHVSGRLWDQAMRFMCNLPCSIKPITPEDIT